MSGIVISCTVANGTPDDLVGGLIVGLWLDDWSPNQLELEISVGEIYNWLVERVSSELGEDNNLTSYWTLTNAGNEPDGLVVNLDVNLATEFGLIPPEGASTGTESSSPRSFEILDVPVGGSVNFSAWMVVPLEAPVETTVVLTVEVRSMREPDISFTAEDSALVPATYVLPPITTEGAWKGALIGWLEVWHEFILIAIVVIAGSIGVVIAIRIRKERELALRGPAPPAEEKAEDWMSKFEEGSEKPPVIVESPQVEAEGFAAEFLEKSGGPSEKPRVGPDKEVVDSASEVLDKYQTEDAIDTAIEIAEEMAEGELPHPSNVMLDPAEAESRKVVPKKHRDDDGPSDYELEL